MPLLSIITINYNNLEGLQRTFQSVFEQTYTDFEYLVIDGGSTDGSKEWIAQHAHRIQYWVSEPDKGIYDAQNKGIEKATGDYILFVNSGDSIYAPETLKALAHADASYDIVYGNTNMILPDGSCYIDYASENTTLLYFLKKTIHHQCTRIRASLLKEDPYDTSFKIVADWVWFLKRKEEGKTFYHLNQTTANFMLDGISNTQLDLVHAERSRVLKEKYYEYYELLEEVIAAKAQNYELRRKIDTLYASRWVKLLKKLGLTKL